MARNVVCISLNDDYVKILDYISKVLNCDRSEALRKLMRNFILAFNPVGDEKLNIMDNYAKLISFEEDLGLDYLKKRFNAMLDENFCRGLV